MHADFDILIFCCFSFSFFGLKYARKCFLCTDIQGLFTPITSGCERDTSVVSGARFLMHPLDSEDGEAQIGEPSMVSSADRRRHEIQDDDVFYQTGLDSSDTNSIQQPPSFSESQFATIVRRQRKRRIVSPTSERLEENRPARNLLSEVLHLSPQQSPSATRRRHQHNRRGSSPDFRLDTVIEESKRQPKLKRYDSKMPKNRNEWNNWQFSGWGSMMMLELSKKELEQSQEVIDKRPKPILEWARAASIAGNALTGSVFYSIPAVLAACTIFTPLSLLLAILLLWPFRPIICQLAQTIQNGDASSYTYLLNVVHRSWIALIAAAIILLDAVATGSVSAATAANYISNQVTLADPSSSVSSFLQGAGVVVVLLSGMTLVSLLGLRDSASIALVMITIHLLTMSALIIAGIVQWARQGNTTLINNWHEAIELLSKGRGIARSIFDGTCIAFVGLTGFEMTPTYVSSVKDGHFTIALRNLHLATLVTEVPLALLVVVLIPLNAQISASSVLAVLAQICSSSAIDGSSSWLKILVVIDAVIVLMGGVMTGIQATCGLCQSLAYDGILAPIFLTRMFRTQAFFMSIGLFLLLSLIFCAVFQFDMATMSSVFSLTFLFVMLSFPISLFLLKWGRPKLEESGSDSTARCGMACVALALAIAITAIAGNVALQPIFLLKTFALALGIFMGFWILKRRVEIARIALWLTDEKWFGDPVKETKESRQEGSRGAVKIRSSIIKWMKRERTKPVVFFTETDEISHLVNALRYVDEVSTGKWDGPPFPHSMLTGNFCVCHPE